MWVTRKPRASINAPIDAEVRPLPMDETTPPVTRTNLVRRLTGELPPSRSVQYHAFFARASLSSLARKISARSRVSLSLRQSRGDAAHLSECAEDTDAEAVPIRDDRHALEG